MRSGPQGMLSWDRRSMATRQVPSWSPHPYLNSFAAPPSGRMRNCYRYLDYKFPSTCSLLPTPPLTIWSQHVLQASWKAEVEAYLRDGHHPARLNEITIRQMNGCMMGREGRKFPLHLFPDLKEASRALNGTMARSFIALLGDSTVQNEASL